MSCMCFPGPQAGPGSVPGGFDAPRRRDPGNAFWNAWSYDVADHGGAQPPGGKEAPAFGFRQYLVKHFLADLSAAVVGAGIPPEMVYAHQIPGEMVGAARSRSGAIPMWTARLDACGTLGHTRFGPYDCALADCYSSNWGEAPVLGDQGNLGFILCGCSLTQVMWTLCFCVF